ARDLGNFLYGLHRIDTKGGNQPTFENGFKGNTLNLFQAEIEDLLNKYKEILPVDLLKDRLDMATRRPWEKEPVWVHGGLEMSNLLFEQGKLTGFTDSDILVLGDPACDLAIAWQVLGEKNRKVFFDIAEADDETIERARFWALSHALKNYQSEDIDQAIIARDTVTRLLKEIENKGNTEVKDWIQL
ncbi:MAG: phosphotransferase, partial [Streptococcaceae bacterium]|nr:phosphotransferase [Streptococcaceae bacterium]MCL2681708.1 phosphotransferase [Streptococcaceae bacterium]